MGSSSYDERDDQRPKQVVYDARESVQAARNEVWGELVGRGSVSLHARRQLATAAVQYWDVLKEYGEDRTTEWEESGVDEIGELVGKTVQVPEPAPGDTSATDMVERPALLSVDPQRLIGVTKRLDTLAKELGFAAGTRDKTPSDEPELSDLRGLLKARGQTEALTKLPGSGGDD
jgi:hypothetical protein